MNKLYYDSTEQVRTCTHNITSLLWTIQKLWERTNPITNEHVPFFSVLLWNIFHSYKYWGSSYSQICMHKWTKTHTYLQVKHPSQLLSNFNQNQNVPTNFSTTISKCVKIYSADLKLQHADRQVALIYECTRQNILNYLYFWLFVYLLPFTDIDNWDSAIFYL